MLAFDHHCDGTAGLSLRRRLLPAASVPVTREVGNSMSNDLDTTAPGCAGPDPGATQSRSQLPCECNVAVGSGHGPCLPQQWLRPYIAWGLALGRRTWINIIFFSTKLHCFPTSECLPTFT